MESSRQTPPPTKFLQLSLALVFQAGSANTGLTETPNWKVITKPGTEETQEGIGGVHRRGTQTLLMSFPREQDLKC